MVTIGEVPIHFIQTKSRTAMKCLPIPYVKAVELYDSLPGTLDPSVCSTTA